MYNVLFCCLCQSQEDSCSHSVTLVVDEDVSRQVTLNREGEVIIGANMVVSLPYSDGKINAAYFLSQISFGCLEVLINVIKVFLVYDNPSPP